MINYSTVKRKNLAKPEEAPKTYAVAQYDHVMDLDQFAEHVASHGSKYDEADITAMSILIVKCLRELLLEGRKVNFGKLGGFWVTLTSRGVEDGGKFSANDITGCSILYSPGKDFEDLMKDAQFRAVATRKLQAAVVKAEKEGATTLNIEEIKRKASTDAKDPEDPEDTNGDDGGDDNPTDPTNGGGSDNSGSGSSETPTGGNSDNGGDDDPDDVSLG